MLIPIKFVRLSKGAQNLCGDGKGGYPQSPHISPLH